MLSDGTVTVSTLSALARTGETAACSTAVAPPAATSTQISNHRTRPAIAATIGTPDSAA